MTKGTSKLRELVQRVMGDTEIFIGTERMLEKAMVPHSTILARKIPWTEEHGGLQSMVSLRVGHD